MVLVLIGQKMLILIFMIIVSTFGNDLISPISTNAFSYYKFKLEGTFYDKNGKLINKIKLLPKRKNDRVFNGSLYIVEDDWAIYGADVSVTGAQVNIPIVDVLNLKQNYNYSEETMLGC